MKVPLTEHNLTHNDKVFFMHIPKTAGTTLNVIVEQQFDRREICPFYYLDELPEISRQLFEQYRYFRGHFNYNVMQKLLPQNPICLTMLREPVERFISNFAHLKRDHSHLFEILSPNTEKSRSMSLAEFVNDSTHSQYIKLQNSQTNQLAVELNFKTLADFKKQVQNQVPVRQTDLERAKNLLDKFAFVGLTERFQDSLFLLAYTFGWQPTLDAPRLNVASDKPRYEELSPETLDRIVEMNNLDLELYAYARQLFEARFSKMTQKLLERYGNRTHAHLKPPLSLEVMQTLLEKHYEQCYAQQHTPTQFLHFQFDQALSGSQWHLIENSPEHGPFRWTGPGTTATLDLPLAADSDLMIKFQVLMAPSSEVLDTLKLSVNNQPVTLIKYPDEIGATIVAGYIPCTVLANSKSYTRLAFAVERTIAPNTVDPDNPDDRQLGVALNWIEINPTSELEWSEFARQMREEELVSVKATLQAREEELASVKFVLQARDEELASIKPVLQAREEALASVKAELAFYENSLPGRLAKRFRRKKRSDQSP